jgi:hypothetical protein
MAGKTDFVERATDSTGVERRSPSQPRTRLPAAGPDKRARGRVRVSKIEKPATTDPGMDVQRPLKHLKVARGMLDRSLQAQLGRQLRAIYADVASEPVPSRFVTLLEELAVAEKPR